MPSLPLFDYFFCFQPAEFGTNSIQFSRGASLDPTSTSFASTNNSTNRESSGAVFEGRRGGEIGREIREREREEGVEGEVKIASDPLSLHLLSNSLNRRGGTRLIAVRIIFTIRVTERNKLELKKKREIGDNSSRLLGRKPREFTRYIIQTILSLYPRCLRSEKRIRERSAGVVSSLKVQDKR